MKRTNPSGNELAGEDWVAANLILLSNDPKESSFDLERKVLVRKQEIHLLRLMRQLGNLYNLQMRKMRMMRMTCL